MNTSIKTNTYTKIYIVETDIPSYDLEFDLFNWGALKTETVPLEGNKRKVVATFLMDHIAPELDMLQRVQK